MKAPGKPPVDTPKASHALDDTHETLGKGASYAVTIDRELLAQAQLPETMQDIMVRLPEQLTLDAPVTLIIGPNGSGKTMLAKALLESMAIARNAHLVKGEGSPIRQTLGFDESSPASTIVRALQVTIAGKDGIGAKPVMIDGTDLMAETKRWATEQSQLASPGEVALSGEGIYSHAKSTRQLFVQSLDSIRDVRIDRHKKRQRKLAETTGASQPDVLVVLDEPEQGLDPDGQLGLPDLITGFLPPSDTLIVPTNNIVLARMTDIPRLDLNHPERGVHQPSEYDELLKIVAA